MRFINSFVHPNMRNGMFVPKYCLLRRKLINMAFSLSETHTLIRHSNLFLSLVNQTTINICRSQVRPQQPASEPAFERASERANQPN